MATLIASERAAAKSSRLQRSAESQRTEWFEEKWPDACSYHHLTSLCASSGGMQQSGMWNVEIWGRGVAKWAATSSQTVCLSVGRIPNHFVERSVRV